MNNNFYKRQSRPKTFEEMLSDFLKESKEKSNDIKKNKNRKRPDKSYKLSPSRFE